MKHVSPPPTVWCVLSIAPKPMVYLENFSILSACCRMKYNCPDKYNTQPSWHPQWCFKDFLTSFNLLHILSCLVFICILAIPLQCVTYRFTFIFLKGSGNTMLTVLVMIMWFTDRTLQIILNNWMESHNWFSLFLVALFDCLSILGSFIRFGFVWTANLHLLFRTH